MLSGSRYVRWPIRRELLRVLDQARVHHDERGALFDDRVGAVDQRVGGGRVNRDEIPVFAGDRLQRVELLLDLEFSVDRLHLDAEQAADERAGLDAVGDPGGSRADFDRHAAKRLGREIVRQHAEVHGCRGGGHARPEAGRGRERADCHAAADEAPAGNRVGNDLGLLAGESLADLFIDRERSVELTHCPILHCWTTMSGATLAARRMHVALGPTQGGAERP